MDHIRLVANLQQDIQVIQDVILATVLTMPELLQTYRTVRNL